MYVFEYHYSLSNKLVGCYGGGNQNHSKRAQQHPYVYVSECNHIYIPRTSPTGCYLKLTINLRSYSTHTYTYTHLP